MEEKPAKDTTQDLRFFKVILSSIADGVFTVDSQRIITSFNPAAERITGIPASKAIGRHCSDVFHSDICENCLLDKTLKTGVESIDRPVSIINSRGEKVPISISTAVLKNDDGEVLGAVNIFRDITKLKEIDRIKSQFVSMVAHELKAPLAAIEGWLELVITGEVGSDAEQCQKYLIRAKERAHTLLALVNDLLEINRMEAGKIAMKMEPVALSDIVQNIANFFKPEAEKRKISIEIKMPENLPSIQADVRDMEKLFTNFINNAIKYNVENGSVIVEGSADQEFVAIRVTDSGVGISEENLSYIFEDFFRVEDEKSKTVPGTGLGLTIAKKIADSHLGHIEVESRLGKGSTFSVYFPRKRK